MSDTARTSVRLVTLANDSAMDETADAARVLVVDSTGAPAGSGLTDAQLRATAVPVSGTVTATGPLTDAQLRAVAVPVSGTVSVSEPVSVDDNAGSLTVDAPVGTPVFVRLSDGSAAIATLPVSLAALPALAAGSANIGDVDVLTVPAPLSTAGGGTEATALRVTLASDSTGLVSVDDNGGSLTVDGSVTALDEDSATGTHANFTGTGASQTIIAANAARKGATVYNDSGVVCYVKLAATASATSFAIKMVDQSYYELPFKYTGVVDAFWASGSVRVVELT